MFSYFVIDSKQYKYGNYSKKACRGIQAVTAPIKLPVMDVNIYPESSCLLRKAGSERGLG